MTNNQRTQNTTKKSNLVFTILAFLVALTALTLQGCKKREPELPPISLSMPSSNNILADMAAAREREARANSNLVAKLAAATNQVAALSEELEKAKNQLVAADNQLKTAAEETGALKAALETATNKISALSGALAEATNQVAAAKAEVAELTAAKKTALETSLPAAPVAATNMAAEKAPEKAQSAKTAEVKDSAATMTLNKGEDGIFTAVNNATVYLEANRPFFLFKDGSPTPLLSGKRKITVSGETLKIQGRHDNTGFRLSVKN